MKTITQTVYKYEELSQPAKDKAREKFYDINFYHDWWDSIYEDAAEAGIKITSFDINYCIQITGRLEESPQSIADNILNDHGKCCGTYQVAEKYLQSLNVLLVKNALLNTDPEDCEEIAELNDTFEKDILQEYGKMLQRDYEYLESTEAIEESIIANEYEFLEDGTKFY